MSTKKIFLLAIISFVMIMMIIGAVFLLISYKNNSEKNTSKELYYYDVGEMYCNLRESKKIIKLKITIEATDKKIIEELDKKNFLIKHEINAIMINKNEKDLEGKEGILVLQSEISNRLSEIFNSKDITKIYFEEIIVQ
ncbi:flagellar basal body-associated FliL family protein [Proteiniborus sp. MB09-C3]|uniref:flagellar basal body-associated FliL family protein n=1 Tax=Proteiniborus sp. MB09-C3 TaxID=3050072 RepID=UPI0025522E57|nr:flagellar basal body-associated FliL family protein [Proteiniborus sp. MB09-C3]WIV10866.1 flagellar basal body-associated FliL family protein [Proteiniborus sp. MB09-C3]